MQPVLWLTNTLICGFDMAVDCLNPSTQYRNRNSLQKSIVDLICVCFFNTFLEKKEPDNSKPEKDANDAMKEHGLLNRKAQININVNQHSEIQENEENTDIIHNLGKHVTAFTLGFVTLL